MTGFGRASGPWRGGRVTVEVRSLNHRYLDVRVKLPPELAALEPRASEWVRGRMVRGHVEVSASADGLTRPVLYPALNMPLAREYARLYTRLAEELGAPTTPEPALLLSMRDVILMKEDEIDIETEWEALMPIFEAAFDELDASAKAEGEKLTGDIRERMCRISELNERAAQFHPDHVRAYREKLAERVSRLGELPELDPDRLAQEVAIYAERSDFTEESVRLRAHIERFGEILESSGPVGRSLDFLAQEMFREMNTISSKAQSAVISQTVVEMKAELEKIREQVQNIV